MNVSPSGTYQPVARPTVAPTAADAGTGSAAVAPSSGEDAVYIRTEQLTQLLSSVRETPEVRADVVESITARLAAGEFSTPAAAGDAAANLLSSGDHR